MYRPLIALACFCWFTACASAEPPAEPPRIERFVAVDNVCAWPNLTVLPDGRIIATIFNRPSHGLESGDVECWESVDGRFWKLAGTPTKHEPQTIRMNVAAGLAANGDLIVLASGWTNVQQPGQPKKGVFRDAILKSWVCRSADGGRTWQVGKEFTDKPLPDKSELIPFGDIVSAADGSLRACCFAVNLNDRSTDTCWMLRSDDDGKTWSVMSLMSRTSNETHAIPLGDKKWLAAARRSGSVIELLRSDDDGQSWSNQGAVTRPYEINGHLLRLADGRLLLSYGNRIKREFGVLARFSNDDGLTWGEPLRIAHCQSEDCGYPSSVQLPRGEIVTAYYAKSVASHHRYHMGVTIWTDATPSKESK